VRERKRRLSATGFALALRGSASRMLPKGAHWCASPQSQGKTCQLRWALRARGRPSLPFAFSVSLCALWFAFIRLGFSLILLRDRGVEQSRDCGAHDRGDPEEPQLLQRPAAHENCLAGAARRVDRSVGHRNADQVDQGQPQPDRDRRTALGRPFVGRAEDKPKEESGKQVKIL